jgi:high frequency lysogenization protein
MADYTQQDKTLALIGLYQAAQLVYDLATTGKADELAFKTTIQSLFVENPQSTLDVFGDDIANLQVGVKTLLAQMSSDIAVQERNIEITRYVLTLIILQKKLSELGTPFEKIAGILSTATSQRAHFGELHENVIASIARAYTENVSGIKPRIMVNGQHGHLQNPNTANKIRALLLAGIRASLLWSQVGGSRWGLILSRKKYLQAAQALYRPEPNDATNDSTNDSHEPPSYFKKD